jgi:ribosomal protein S19E (S16A)
MTRIDRLIGLDDERARQERAPLWKRAVWHMVKSLVRKHPGAAISTASAGAAYAARTASKEIAETVGEKLEDIGVIGESDDGRSQGAQANALRESMSPEALRALADLKRSS